MTREEIVAALEALADELHESGVDGEMYVVGGAAIAIAFDARRSTRDIDAVFEPKAAIYAAAERVGARRGLPAGWLTDADAVLEVAEAVFGDRLDAAARFFVEELFAEAP